MNLDDLKDNLKNQLSQTWSHIEESAIYNQLRDRFENLSPRRQKLTLMGTGALIALLILMVPFSYFTDSSQSISDFENKRSLIREMLKASREASEAPDLPPAPPADMMRGTIEGQFKAANLLPEQMKGIQVMAADTGLIPKNLLAEGLKVNLAKLNLRQIIDISYNLQSLSPSVKMNEINITANAEDARYFDVEFHLASLAVPQMALPEIIEDDGGGKNKKNGIIKEKDSGGSTGNSDSAGGHKGPNGPSGSKKFQRGGDH